MARLPDVPGRLLPMWQMLSRVREKSFRLQPESSNTIARPDALNIASSVVSPL
jgi:hypothetical protein